MNEKTSLLKKEYLIGVGDVDFKMELKMSALLDYFQDIASLASTELGYGIHELVKNFNVIWVLIRIRVDIERMPCLDERITIETWPREPKAIEFGRDFIVRDQFDEIIAKSVSSWVLLDTDTRKIQKSKRFNIKYPNLIDNKAIDCKLKKITMPEALNTAYEKVIGYSDIDVNGHVNNTKYIEYILDSFTFDAHKNYSVTSLQVNFINEALPGDTLTVLKSDANHETGYVYVEGIKKREQNTIFTGKISFKEKVTNCK